MIAAPDEPVLGWSRSTRLRQALAEAGAMATSDLPLVIEGEPGTGKTQLARWVHRRSPRAPQPFSNIDLSTIPADVFGRELFGHEAGAFTGALHSHPGRLRLAHGGTVLFDRIDALVEPCQRQLLRVFEQGEITPLGASRAERVDVRLLHTSERPLRECVADGTLREDLYYRMNVLTLRLPPLRERREDLAYLLSTQLQIHAQRLRRAPPRLSSEVLRLMERYPWPGNMTELDHALVAILTLCPGERIQLGDLPGDLRSRFLEPQRPSARVFSIPGRLAFRDQVQAFERALLQRVWGECQGDRERFLAQLDLAPHQLRYQLVRLGLELRS